MTDASFPLEKRELWRELMEAFSRVPDAQRGHMIASIGAMTPLEASHHARTLLKIYEWTCHMRERED